MTSSPAPLVDLTVESGDFDLPIAAATWQTWFECWLADLSPAEMPYLARSGEAAIAAADPQAAEPESREPESREPESPAEPASDPAPAYELALCLMDDAAIHALNARYRQRDAATDVLAFAALETDMPDLGALGIPLPRLLGDIAISVETARRQARDRGHSLETELAWLAAHGLLHLLGWDHPDEARLAAMLDRQVRLLRAIDLAPADWLPADWLPEDSRPVVPSAPSAVFPETR